MSESNVREEVIDKVKEVIDAHFDDARCGIFDCRNWVGDPMYTIFEDEENKVTVDICYNYAYFEIFGLSDEEFKIVSDYYNDKK